MVDASISKEEKNVFGVTQYPQSREKPKTEEQKPTSTPDKQEITTLQKTKKKSGSSKSSASPTETQVSSSPFVSQNTNMSSEKPTVSFVKLATQTTKPKETNTNIFGVEQLPQSREDARPVATSATKPYTVLYSDKTERQNAFLTTQQLPVEQIKTAFPSNEANIKRIEQQRPTQKTIGANLTNTGVRASQISTLGAKSYNFAVGGAILAESAPVVASVPYIGPPLAIGAGAIGGAAFTIGEVGGLGVTFRKLQEESLKGKNKDILMSDMFNIAYDEARIKESEERKGIWSNFKSGYGQLFLFAGARVEGAQVVASKVKTGGRYPIGISATDFRDILSPESFEQQYAKDEAVFRDEFLKNFRGTPAETQVALKEAVKQRRQEEVTLGLGVYRSNIRSEGASLQTNKIIQQAVGKTTSRSIIPSLIRTGSASFVGGGQEAGTQYINEQLLRNSDINPLDLALNVASGATVSTGVNVVGQSLQLQKVSTEGFKSKLYGGASKAYNFVVDITNLEEKEPDITFSKLSNEQAGVQVRKSVVFDTSFNTGKSQNKVVTFTPTIVSTTEQTKQTTPKVDDVLKIGKIPTIETDNILGIEQPDKGRRKKGSGRTTTPTTQDIINDVIPDTPVNKQPTQTTTDTINNLTNVTNIYNFNPTRNINPINTPFIPPFVPSLGGIGGGGGRKSKVPVYQNELAISLGLLGGIGGFGGSKMKSKPQKREKVTKKSKKQSLSKRLDANFNKANNLLFGGFKI